MGNNAVLMELNLPLLTKVGELFRIVDNPKLPSCHAQALRNQLASAPPAIAISGNNDAATSP